MVIFTKVFFMLACLTAVAVSSTPMYFNVLDYGAMGDGQTDDSNAFLRAWNDACGSKDGDLVNLIVPGGKTFLVNPTMFKGPCKVKNINFSVYGTIRSPETIHTWNGMDATRWLAFESVDGLTVDGSGTIDGQGSNWWAQSCKHNHGKGCTKWAPTAIKFLHCNDVNLRNLSFINSANTHILIQGCDGFHVTGLSINSPKSSPNTDGIHISNSKNVVIDNSDIKSGDDCVSIGDHSSQIRVNNINCGPGHGVSIGSLGKGGSYVQVENIYVSNVNFYGTTNGARIKTWQGATGYARNIIFENINFNSVQNPIIIDQYYCSKDVQGSCDNMGKNVSGVHISNVTYRNVSGTSSTRVAIKLNCSQSEACTGILLDSVQLTLTQSSSKHRHYHNQPQHAVSSCTNAHGVTNGVVQPSVYCLAQE